MTNINKYLDHTLLTATATAADVETLCRQAVEYDFAAVCVNPVWCSLAAAQLAPHSYTKIASVIDFPLGSSSTASRLHQTERALLDGADEIDLVAPLHSIQSSDWEYLYRDLSQICTLCGTRAIVKVILEVSLFTPEQVQQATRTAIQAGCHMIKTSTGILNTRPSSLADCDLIRSVIAEIGSDTQIKISGGVKTTEQARQFIEAGANRIGSSNAIGLALG